MALISQKYQNVREGVAPIMRGKIIDYEAKTIRNAALKEGRDEERLKAIAETEERAKDMIRDRMDLSLV